MKKQAFSCRYRQENSYICIKLVSFLPIIYGIPLQGFARLFYDKVLSNKTPCKCKSIDCLCFCAYRAHCLLSILPFKAVALGFMCFCTFVACCFDL